MLQQTSDVLTKNKCYIYLVYWLASNETSQIAPKIECLTASMRMLCKGERNVSNIIVTKRNR